MNVSLNFHLLFFVWTLTSVLAYNLLKASCGRWPSRRMALPQDAFPDFPWDLAVLRSPGKLPSRNLAGDGNRGRWIFGGWCFGPMPPEKHYFSNVFSTFFIFLQETISFFSLFHFLHDSVSPARAVAGATKGRRVGGVDSCKKWKKWKKQMVFLQTNEKCWKNIWKIRFSGQCHPKSIIFLMCFQHFSFFCKKPLVFFSLFHFLHDSVSPARAVAGATKGRRVGGADSCKKWKKWKKQMVFLQKNENVEKTFEK